MDLLELYIHMDTEYMEFDAEMTTYFVEEGERRTEEKRLLEKVRNNEALITSGALAIEVYDAEYHLIEDLCREISLPDERGEIDVSEFGDLGILGISTSGVMLHLASGWEGRGFSVTVDPGVVAHRYFLWLGEVVQDLYRSRNILCFGSAEWGAIQLPDGRSVILRPKKYIVDVPQEN